MPGQNDSRVDAEVVYFVVCLVDQLATMGEEQDALPARYGLADELGGNHGLAGAGGSFLKDAPIAGGDLRVRQCDKIELVGS